MEVGIYLKGRSVVVKLLADDADDAAVLAAHVTSGAPDGIEVSRDDTVVTVARDFPSESDAAAWAESLRAGMVDGHLFNLEFGEWSSAQLH